MHDVTDMDLLRQYAVGNSDAAFAALVSRHVDLVYSAALRKTGNLHAAEEITQAVFIILAQKAGRILDKTILPGWLYQTARLTASSFLRRETRRVRREQEAFMQTEPYTVAPEETWEQLAPLLEDAMGQLGDKDRAAVVLRFFGGKSFAEVATAAGVSENAAKKRVIHALEKLHRYFSRRGVSSTTAIIAGAISTHSVQAAPVALAKTVTAVAVAKGAAASGSTLTLIKGALKIMAWTKVKSAMVVGAAVVLAAGTAMPIIVHHHRANASVFTSTTELTDSDNANYEKLTGAMPEQVARAFLEAFSKEDWTEAARYWWSDPHNKNSIPSIPDGLKQGYGGLEIISLGKPFKARISIARLLEMQPESRNQFKGMPPNGDFESPDVFVPYEIRLKTGTIRKWQLSISCDDPEHRWYFDGGL